LILTKNKEKTNLSIEVRKLSHWYNSHPAVNDISFSVTSGSILGLLGPNGAGKSTTIKILTTLLPPTSGMASILGYDIEKNPIDVRKCIGYVPQLLSADGDLTGYENLDLSAKLYSLPYQKREKKIEELLEFMGLEKVAHQLVNQYSGGMIRRLEIAQALVHEPEVLFLDEPTVGLDPVARRALWKRIQEWQEEFHTTILITTHDMEEADKLCDQVAFMYEGHIITMDSPSVLKARVGNNATLNDVFIHYTGTSIQEEKDYTNVQQIRRTISHL
jgi:ABC-2 type transport system ATP-binding protein